MAKNHDVCYDAQLVRGEMMSIESLRRLLSGESNGGDERAMGRKAKGSEADPRSVERLLGLNYDEHSDQFTVDRVEDYPLFSFIRHQSHTGQRGPLQSAEYDLFLQKAQEMGVALTVYDRPRPLTRRSVDSPPGSLRRR